MHHRAQLYGASSKTTAHLQKTRHMMRRTANKPAQRQSLTHRTPRAQKSRDASKKALIPIGAASFFQNTTCITSRSALPPPRRIGRWKTGTPRRIDRTLASLEA